MAALLQIGLANAAAAALLAVVALVAGRYCRRPAVLHGLWLLVILKLVTPPVVPLPLRGWPALPAEPTPAAPVAGAAAPAPTAEPARPPEERPAEMVRQFLLVPLLDQDGAVLGVQVMPPDLDDQAVATPAPAPPPPAAAPAVAPTAPPAVDPDPGAGWRKAVSVFGGVWVAGSVLWFSAVGVCIIRFRRLLRHARPAPAEVEAQARELAGRMGLARCPRIALVPGPVPPMVWMAVGRPAVFLPAGLIGQLEEAERASLLAHELAHVRRRDHWVRWVELLAQGIYWWYPVVWLARRQLQVHEEECCDAWVVGEVPARSYAAAILRTLDFLAEPPALPAIASGLGRVAALKRRLTRILCDRTPKRLSVVGRLAFVALALAVLPLVPAAMPTEAAVPEPTAAPVVAALGSSEQPSAPTEKPVQGVMTARRATVRYTLALRVTDLLVTPRPGAPAGGTAGLLAVTFSPDGSRLAVAADDGSVQVRDPATDRVTLTLRGHTAAVNCLAFSPDGRTLATGSSDRTVKLWDLAAGRERATLSGHRRWVYALAFSPDGRTLASGGYDRTIKLWDAETGAELASLTGHTSSVRALAFAPDGRTLASGGGDRTVRLWDVAARAERRRLDGHSATVRAVAFAPDGNVLASASDDETVRLWDPATGMARATLRGHTAEVTSLAFAPSGRVLVSGGLDRSLRHWNVGIGRVAAAVPGHRFGVTGVAIAPDGRSAASVGQDRTVRLWSPATRLPAPLADKSEGVPAKFFYFAPGPPAGSEFPRRALIAPPPAGVVAEQKSVTVYRAVPRLEMREAANPGK
jgi:beta-lactamase regulating signal transducer with metallopeptidase domain